MTLIVKLIIIMTKLMRISALDVYMILLCLKKPTSFYVDKYSCYCCGQLMTVVPISCVIFGTILWRNFLCLNKDGAGTFCYLVFNIATKNLESMGTKTSII